MSVRYLLFWLVTCIVFGLDRSTKVWAESHLSLGESVVGIPGWFEWSLYHNPGAAGGLFSGYVGVLILISLAAVVGILLYVYKGAHDRNLCLLTGLGLLLGGALGNLYDRIVYHHVIDFINPIDATYIYNIADKGIRWGLYLSLIGLWLARRRVAKHNQNMVS
ncbi:MAG TPA: signal peptidase II [Bacilli bacterium]|nr:signal peptidase II [Bacilli bacterium]